MKSKTNEIVVRKSKPKNLDEIYKTTNSYGYYQLFFFVVMQLGCLVQAGNGVASWLWLGDQKPTYICYFSQDNVTKITPKEVGNHPERACHLIKTCPHGNLTIENSWRSIYQDFEFACGSETIRTTIQSLRPIVHLFVFMISGHLIDYFGRKWIMIVGFGAELVFSIGQAVSPNFTIYLIFYFCATSSDYIYTSAQFPLIVESVHSKYRLIQGFAFSYSIAYVVGGMIGYLTKSWRTHIIVINSLGVIPLILMLFLQESPRFLMRSKKFNQASNAINKMTKFNRKSNVRYTADDLREINSLIISSEENKGPTKRYTAFDIFSNWKLTFYALAQIVTGFTINLTSDTIMQNYQSLNGNIFMDVSLGYGVLRIWTPFAAVALENCRCFKNFGRKKMFLISQGIITICFAIMFCVELFDLNNTFHWVGTASTLVGIALEIGVVQVLYKMYTTELFPTVIRAIALNTFSTTSLAGSSLAPWFKDLKKYWSPLPFCGSGIFTAASLILAAFILPETKFTTLPDTISEATKRDELPIEDEEPIYTNRVDDFEQINKF